MVGCMADLRASIHVYRHRLVIPDRYWLGNRMVASELRLRVAKFGVTPEDRARLKLSVGDPDNMPAPTRLWTKAAYNRRARLLRAVDADGQKTTP